MRLLNTRTLDIREFQDEDGLPPYAILSHTWGPPEQECTLQSMAEPNISSRWGYAKIKYCCDQARSDGLDWAWVDTCCIDKTSTAELSEAINSMFRWYRNSSVCYAYLQDVNTVDGLAKSRWFTRGWTLQELIAPQHVTFYSASWADLGSKLVLRDMLSKITGIEATVLELGNLSGVTVAKKMSWAAKRQTTRVEDLAYCLLGIFDVNMPLLYGEGRRSFIRLQQEIMRSSYDHTLFAWSLYPANKTADEFARAEATRPTTSEPELYGLLADSPTLFAHTVEIQPLEDDFQSGSEVTPRGGSIAITLPTFKKGSKSFAALSCIADDNYVALPLSSWGGKYVARQAELVFVRAEDLYTSSGSLRMQDFLVKAPISEPVRAPLPRPRVSYIVMVKSQDNWAYHLDDVRCSTHAVYDHEAHKLTLSPSFTGLHAACFIRPKYRKIPIAQGYLWRAAVLIGGDVAGTDTLWVAIIPILPDVDTATAFQRLSKEAPNLVQQCATRSMLVDQLASGNRTPVFAKLDQPKARCLVSSDRWVGYEWDAYASEYSRIKKHGVIHANAEIKPLHCYVNETASELSITFDTGGHWQSNQRFDKPPPGTESVQWEWIEFR